jgi:hypothetical protein
MTNVVSLITCVPTGKSYVGVTKSGCRNPGKDFEPLRYGHGTRFSKVVKRYGKKAFTIRILGCGYRTRESLHKAEQKFIKKYETLVPNGYNVTIGGAGPDYGPAFHKSAMRGFKRRAKNSKWQASVRAHMRRLHKTPKFRAHMRRLAKSPKRLAAVRRLHKNPKYLAARRLMYKSPTWLASVRAATRRAGKRIRRFRKMGIPPISKIMKQRKCSYGQGRIIQLKMAA